MGRVRIVTDSSACVPPDLVAQHEIEVLPLFLAFGDQVYQDGMSETSAEFYEVLRTAKEPPTTSAPSPGAYEETFLRLGKEADAIVCITVSRQFSAIHDAAVQGAALAKEQSPELDIRVLDSTVAAMAEGFVVLEAARAAQAGAAVEEVVARADTLIPRVQMLAAIDTLTYMARTGRVPRLVVWASSPLQVKPIVAFQRGVYRLISIARTRRRALDRLVQELERRARDGGALHVCVHHTNAPQDAEALAERVRSSLQPKELFLVEFNQAMGVHAGPGLLGVAFYTEEA